MIQNFLSVNRWITLLSDLLILQPKWNNALLEMFRIDYIGTSPYITCSPSLCHHRLEPKDKFLILSSDGLYQYFTNEEAVAEVETFMLTFPEGDPAQHLVEEVLFRAAKKAGKIIIQKICSKYTHIQLPKSNYTNLHVQLQEWISMNCLISHKGIEGGTMTTSRLSSFPLKEEYGVHPCN